MTFSTCSRLIPLMVAMARPSFCTSLAPMCLSTSAASPSPSESSSTAARCTPVNSSGLLGRVIAQPVRYDLGDPLGVGLDRIARVAQAVLVGAGGQRDGLARGRADARGVRGQFRILLAIHQ